MNILKKVMLLACAAFTLTGCSLLVGTQPGELSSGFAKVSKQLYLRMEPVWLTSDVKLGMYWDERLEAEHYFFDVLAKSTANIEEGTSLQVNIDGAHYVLATVEGAMDAYTKTHYASLSGWSFKRYKIDKATVEAMLNAKETVLIIETSKTFINASFTPPGATASENMHDKFRAFIEKAAEEKRAALGHIDPKTGLYKRDRSR